MLAESSLSVAYFSCTVAIASSASSNRAATAAAVSCRRWFALCSISVRCVQMSRPESTVSGIQQTVSVVTISCSRNVLFFSHARIAVSLLQTDSIAPRLAKGASRGRNAVQKLLVVFRPVAVQDVEIILHAVAFQRALEGIPVFLDGQIARDEARFHVGHVIVQHHAQIGHGRLIVL